LYYLLEEISGRPNSATATTSTADYRTAEAVMSYSIGIGEREVKYEQL
jgi:hypothetical protein